MNFSLAPTISANIDIKTKTGENNQSESIFARDERTEWEISRERRGGESVQLTNQCAVLC